MATTPVFLPGESHGQRGLVGYSLWGCKELDTIERQTHTHTHTHLSRCSKGLHSIFDEPVFDKNSRNTGVDFSFSSETMATTDQLHPLDSSLDSPHCKAPRIHAIRSCWRVLLDDCHKGAPHRKLFSSTSMTSTGIFQSFALVKPFSRKYC